MKFKMQSSLLFLLLISVLAKVAIATETPDRFQTTNLLSNNNQALETLTNGNWKITIIDPGANKNQLAKPAVVLNKGNLLIAYFSKEGLSLATLSPEGKWSVELIDQTKESQFEGGGRPIDRISMKLDSNDQPHIAYSQHTKVMYASKVNKRWITKELHDEGWIIFHLSIDFHNNHPEISYNTFHKNLKDSWDGVKWSNSSRDKIIESEASDKIIYLGEQSQLPCVEGDDGYDPNDPVKVNKWYRQLPQLAYHDGAITEKIESVCASSATLTTNSAGNPCLIYVGWKAKEDVQDQRDEPKDGQGLRYAERISAQSQPTAIDKLTVSTSVAKLLTLPKDTEIPIITEGKVIGHKKIPAGTSVTILQEYPASYYVTTTDNITFFVEKKDVPAIIPERQH